MNCLPQDLHPKQKWVRKHRGEIQQKGWEYVSSHEVVKGGIFCPMQEVTSSALAQYAATFPQTNQNTIIHPLFFELVIHCPILKAACFQVYQGFQKIALIPNKCIPDCLSLHHMYTLKRRKKGTGSCMVGVIKGTHFPRLGSDRQNQSGFRSHYLGHYDSVLITLNISSSSTCDITPNVRKESAPTEKECVPERHFTIWPCKSLGF